MGKEIDCALGVYPYGRRNKDKLLGCELIEQTYCEQLKAQVFIFQDKYRRLKIDLFILESGEVLLGDFYGDTMKREDMYFVFVCGAKE